LGWTAPNLSLASGKARPVPELQLRSLKDRSDRERSLRATLL
jgi:hypothetical protein